MKEMIKYIIEIRQYFYIYYYSSRKAVHGKSFQIKAIQNN